MAATLAMAILGGHRLSPSPHQVGAPRRQPVRSWSAASPAAVRGRSCRAATQAVSKDVGVCCVPELTISESEACLESLDLIVLDCDGVLWRASDPVPLAADAVATFRARGKRVLFVTNNSSKSRADCCAKLNSFGMGATPEEVVTSGYAAAQYLVSKGFGGSGKRVFVVGDRGLESELETAGIEYFGGSSFEERGRFDLAEFQAMVIDRPVDAVVCGFDGAFTFNKLAYAVTCLRESPGCLFVATNLDNGDNVGEGEVSRIMPGTGCLVRCVETGAGQTAFNVGKGGSWILPYLVQSYGVEPTRSGVVGDRLDTDIATAVAGGMRSFLPLTGVTSLEDVSRAHEDTRPDFYMPSIARLAGLE